MFYIPISQTIELLEEKVRSLTNDKGLVIDRLESDVYKDQTTVLKVLLSTTTTRDRKDLIDMFDTLDGVMGRFDRSQETDIERLGDLKPRFSRVCLLSDEQFHRLNSTEIRAFFEELERRYVLCHGGELEHSKFGRRFTRDRTKSAQQRKLKKQLVRMKRSKSFTRSKESVSSNRQASSDNTPSKPSITSRNFRRERKSVIEPREMYAMEMRAQFTTYDARRKDINHYLESQRMKNPTSGVSQELIEQVHDLFIWVMSSNSNEPQIRIHEIVNVFRDHLPPKIQQEVAERKHKDRFFRLNRPPFINEIDGVEDGGWFPSITDTIGLYSAEKDHSFCIYPIVPTATYCGISRQNQRKSVRQLDQKQIFELYLKPNERVSLQTVFHPKEAGLFGKTLRLNVAGWPGLGEQVEITGVADIPHVDLNLRILFPPHCYAEEEVPDVPNLSVVQQTILELGPTLISKDKQFQAESYLNFKNISRVTCKIRFSISGDDAQFKLRGTEKTLKQGESYLLNVTAQPSRPGFSMCDIIVSIEDNPMPILIEARVEGIKIDVKAEPDSIRILNILLTRTGEALVKITNKTWFPIEWKFERGISDHPYLLVAKTSGALASEESTSLSLCYRPTKPQELDLLLRVMVRPKMGSGAKYTLGPTVKLSLSSRDLALNLKSSSGDDRYLNFPEVYVNTEQIQSFVITNLSQFPFRFEVKRNKQLASDIVREFHFNPLRGTIAKGFDQSVKVLIKSSRSLTLRSSPILLVEIWDVMENVVIAELPVLITCRVVYPNYSIKPLEDISFGNVAVGESGSLIFTIENHGNLPLTYVVFTEDQNKVDQIVDLVDNREPEKNGKRDWRGQDHYSFFIKEKDKLLRLKDKRHPNVPEYQKGDLKITPRKHGKIGRGKKPISEPAKRMKSKSQSIGRRTTFNSRTTHPTKVVKGSLTRKNRSSSLRWSLKKPTKKPQSEGCMVKNENLSMKDVPFVWKNSTGELLPHRTTDVLLTFTPEEKGDWKKKFLFKIEKSQSGPHAICIHGSGVLPSINHSLKDVLRDALIDQSPDAVQSAIAKGYPCNVYEEESHTLHCYNYIVGQRAPFRLYLVNDGIVNATVKLYFTNEAKVANCFSFSNGRTDVAITISPKTTKPIVLFLSPNSTDLFESTLHIDLQLPHEAERFHCILKMRGVGNIPVIEIIKPEEYDAQENKFSLNIGDSFIGYPMTDFFTFMNTGNVVAKVMLEFEKCQSIFTFHARRDYKEIMKHPLNSPLIDPVCVALSPDQHIDINVVYNAKSKVMDACTVYLHVIGNPYDTQVLYIYGKGVQKELVLDLPMKCKVPEAKPHRRKALTTANQLGFEAALNATDSLRSSKLFYHELEFPSMLPKQFEKKTFTVNNATYFTFRLVFPKLKMVWFVPSVCHIAAHSEIEIVAVFRAEEEISYSEMVTALFEPIAHTKLLDSMSWLNASNLHKRLLASPGFDLSMKASDLMEVEGNEPGYEVLSSKSVDSRTVNLLLTARAGIPHIKMRTECINFPLTKCREEAFATLFLENEGFVQANCMIELNSLEKNGWSEVGATSCSMGILTSGQLLNVKELKDSEDPSNIERDLGYIVAPKPMPQVGEASNRSQDESDIKLSLNGITLRRDYNPFSVTPVTLTIPPGETKYVKVAFRPMENCSARCQLKVWDILENIEKTSQLDGKSEFSLCHILCEPRQLLGLEHPDTKHMEIRACAFGTTAKKQFSLINNHSAPFHFHLDREESESEISCHPSQGFIASGCQEEITIAYDPASNSEVQTHWTLNIPAVNIRQCIRIDGKVIPPEVRLVPAAITVPAILTGMLHSVDLALVNDDDVKYEFTLHHLPMILGRIDCEIIPKRGTIEPKQSVSVKVEFFSENSGNIQLEISCDLEGFNSRSIAVIFAEFIELKCKLSWFKKDGEKKKLETDIINDINLSYIEPENAHTVNFTLANYGQGAFRYRWIENEHQEKHGFVTYFNELEGCVPRQSTETLLINFILENNIKFQNHVVKLQVYRGPSYSLRFSGHSELPYRFSFKKFDFGKCPIRPAGVCDCITTLFFSNESDQIIVLGNEYLNKPHLKVLWTGGEVRPRETVPVMVEFYPSEQIHYIEYVQFSINDSICEIIEFTGDGVIISVRIEDPMKDTVDMTKVPVGTTLKKSRKIVNHSHLPVTCRLELDDWPDLTLQPISFTMNERCSRAIYFEYSPKSKSQAFTVNVFVNTGVMKDFLARVKCSSSHISVKLDKKMLLFGRAVKYCSVKMSVNLINDGDIGVNYYWNLDKLNSLLTVIPEQGYLAQHSTLQVNLSLLSLRKMNINHKIKLIYNENQEEELKILGEFTEIPDPFETINFKTPVRTSITYTIDLENKSGDTQVLFPVLIGEFYSSPDFIEIKPRIKSPYTVTYSPRTMTTEIGHSGRLFVPFPDGSCVYYALIGESLAPDPEELFNWTVITKKPSTYEFSIKNWMNSFQRLMAVVCLDKQQQGFPQGMVSIMGEPTICIGSLSSTSYQVEVTVCKQMAFSFRMFFTNPETKEYLYFVVNVKSLPPPEPEPIHLNAAVGSRTTTRLKLTNPFSEPVEFRLRSPIPELTAPNVTAAPLAQVEFIVAYAPNVVEEPKTVECQIVGEPLDEEIYSFFLVSRPSTNDGFPPKQVDCYLGNSVDFCITVQNPTKIKAFYNVLVSSDELRAHENQFEIQPNKGFILNVLYEPQEIGKKHFTVELHSTLNNTIRYLVSATCHPPKLMGPLIVEEESFASIKFKNVLLERAKYMLHLHNEFFKVSMANNDGVQLPGLFELESKEMAFLVVELRLQDGPYKLIENFPIAEKLVIEMIEKGGEFLKDEDIIKWTWCVRGLPRRTESEREASEDQVNQ